MSRPASSRPVWRLKFERKGLHLHITLVDKNKLAAEQAQAEAALKMLALQELKDRSGLMHEQLSELLRRHSDARRVLRHLAMFEGLLRRRGPAVLEEAPIPLLRTALRQLEGLVTNWQPKGLAELRSRLAVAIAKREALEDTAPHAPQRSNFLDENRLKVEEVSASDFHHAQTNWALPPEVKPD